MQTKNSSELQKIYVRNVSDLAIGSTLEMCVNGQTIKFNNLGIISGEAYAAVQQRDGAFELVIQYLAYPDSEHKDYLVRYWATALGHWSRKLYQLAGEYL